MPINYFLITFDKLKNKIMNKWTPYDEQIKPYLENRTIKYNEIAKEILNSDYGGHKNPDVKALGEYIRRHEKRITDTHEGIYNATNSLDVPNTSVKHMWLKDKEKSIFVKNPNYQEIENDFSKLQSELIDQLKKYSPKFPKLKREISNEENLFVIDPADIHIGKLASAFECGESYNNNIAVQRVLQGVKGLLNKAQGVKIDKILFVGGNDILHIDNPKRTTTSGTPQDTDGMWHTNFLIAKQLYVDVLEILLSVADVHFVFNPSNHDYTNGFFLAQVIEAHFRNCENITFDNSIAHRKYFKYGKNLIGTSHGDGAKMLDLPMLMATEKPIEWSETKHRYIYVHHLHHKWSKDVLSVCVEGLRSPSGTDSWHHRNGYEHAPKAVEGFIHSKEHGQIARLTHIF